MRMQHNGNAPAFQADYCPFESGRPYYRHIQQYIFLYYDSLGYKVKNVSRVKKTLTANINNIVGVQMSWVRIPPSGQRQEVAQWKSATKLLYNESCFGRVAEPGLLQQS